MLFLLKSPWLTNMCFTLLRQNTLFGITDKLKKKRLSEVSGGPWWWIKPEQNILI